MTYSTFGWIAAAGACVMFLAASYRLARAVQGVGVMPAFFTAALAQILIVGYVLSATDQLANDLVWLVASLVVFGVVHLSVRKLPPLGAVINAHGSSMSAETILLGTIFFVVASMQLAIIIAAAPHNLDSMTYRMPRVGYYLQHGNIRAFDSNFWAQWMHPKNSAVAMTFLTLVARGWSNAAQFLQFFSWFVFVGCNFGVASRLGATRRAALLMAFAGGLTIEVVMQATTTQDDLFIAALGASFLYFGIGAIRDGSRREGVLAAAAIGIALGTKISAIPFLFAVTLVLTGLTFHLRGRLQYREWVRRVAVVGTLSLLGCALFGLPAGYWENQQDHGSPLGHPYAIAAKTLQSSNTLAERVHYGTVNSARYALDFIDASGIPESPSTKGFVESMRLAYIRGVEAAGIELDAAPTIAPPYQSGNVYYVAHEDRSYWGVWGPLWFLPLMLCALAFSRSRPLASILLGGCVVFWLLQAFTSIYDPWRGRYFIQLLVLVVPVAALGWDRVCPIPWARRIFFVIALLCGLVSVNSVLTRHNSPWWETLQMTWVEQVTRNTPELERVFTAIDNTVPQDAAVIVILEEAYSEFPLFGRRMTRQLYPAPTIERLAALLADKRADYIVFNRLLERGPEDCSLGAGMFLRRLGDALATPCVTSNSPRLKDLSAIQTALQRYRLEHGSYPVSQGWDGFMSQWGNPAPDWIDALTPEYIDVLPVAVRLSDADWAMYLYRSDGLDYKMIVVAASDAGEVIAYYPEMKDPSSSTLIFGVWTDGASDWKFD